MRSAIAARMMGTAIAACLPGVRPEAGVVGVGVGGGGMPVSMVTVMNDGVAVIDDDRTADRVLVGVEWGAGMVDDGAGMIETAAGALATITEVSAMISEGDGEKNKVTGSNCGTPSES